MRKIYILFLPVIACLLIGFGTAQGQLYAPTLRVWASVEDGPNFANIQSYGVTNNGGAYDSDPQTYSILNSTFQIAGLGSPFQNLGFAGPIPAGTTLHIKVGTAGGLLNLLGGIRVQTYNSNSLFASIVDDKIVGGSGSVISLLSGGNQIDVTIKTSAQCQYLRISFPALASIAGAYIRLYGVYYEQPLPSGTVSCDQTSDYLYGVQANALLDAASITNGVVSPQYAVDGDPNTYATIVQIASVLNYTHVTALWPGASKNGDSVRVILGQAGTILNLNLLTNLSIQTFTNDTLVDDLNNQSTLLNLRLLDGSTDKYVLSFVPTGSFNRVSVRNGAIVSANLGGSYNIYEIQRLAAAPQFNAGTRSTTIYSGNSYNLPTLTPKESSDIANWYDASTNTQVSSNTITPSSTTSYYAKSSRNGCTEASAQSALYTVNVVTATPPTSALQ